MSGSKDRTTSGEGNYHEKLERRYDPFTLRLAEDLLRLRKLEARTRDERRLAKERVEKVRFLRTAYRLLRNMRHGPSMIQKMSADVADWLEADVRRIEDDIATLLDELMPRQEKKSPSRRLQALTR